MTDRYPGLVVGLVAMLALVPLAGCVVSEVPVIGSGQHYTPGETVELDHGSNKTYAVTITDYRMVDSYEPSEPRHGSRVTAPEDQKYLFVKVRVTNVGEKSGTPPEVEIRPKSERVFSTIEPVWMDDGWYSGTLFSEPLGVGETRTGWVQVRVPGNVTAEDVRIAFSGDMFVTGSEYRWRLREE